MQTVRSETELEPKVVAIEGREPIISEARYIRCLTDQTVLVRDDTGECFKRRDGQRWAAAGYKVNSGGVQPATAPEDYTNSRQQKPAA